MRAVDCLRFETLVNFAITVIAIYAYSTRVTGTFYAKICGKVWFGGYVSKYYAVGAMILSYMMTLRIAGCAIRLPVVVRKNKRTMGVLRIR